MIYTRREIREKYFNCINDMLSCGIDNIDSSSTLTQMGADSLDLAELVMCVEAEFDIELLESDVFPMIERPLSDHIDLIAEQLQKQSTERRLSIGEKYRMYILFAIFLAVAALFVWLLGVK